MENQAFALMGRLHVILRRETGRVTDIEYMLISPDYCRHVLEVAAACTHADVPGLVARLQEILFGPVGLFAKRPPPAAPPASQDRKYVGTLR